LGVPAKTVNTNHVCFIHRESLWAPAQFPNCKKPVCGVGVGCANSGKCGRSWGELFRGESLARA